MLVKCINKKCLHSWEYRGKSKEYISCPMCYYRFKINRAIVRDMPINPIKNEFKATMLNEKPQNHIIPTKKETISPLLNLLHKSHRFIGDEDMLDGNVLPYDKLPKLPGDD